MDLERSVVSFKAFWGQINPDHVSTFLHWVRETADGKWSAPESMGRPAKCVLKAIGAWKAVRQEFPDALIKGCAFHFNQASWRKTQELGLKTTYDMRGPEYRYIRSLMALPFLPAADIQPVFDHLEQKANSTELQQLVRYIHNNWLTNPVWHPRNWNIFQHSIRTNNDVEDYLQNTAWRHKDNADIILDNIKEDLRTSLPMNASSPTETIHIPTSGPNADCDPKKTVHVDAFLYDDEIIDELCKKGQMSRNYCTECGSYNTKPLTFLSHSASANQIKYIFSYLLSDLMGKTVLDVGLRTGAVLYGAYVYSQASSIVGVEMDSSFCQLQNTIVQKYKMQDRIKVIQSDIQQQAELLQSCTVMVLNNVFEFFMPIEKQLKIWEFLKQILCKKDTMIVTVPCIEQSLSSIKSDINVHSWVKEIDIQDRLRMGNFALYKTSEESDLEAIHLYKVL